MLWPPYRARRVIWHNLADNQPVEEHPDCGKLKFYGRRGDLFLKAFNVGSDMHRSDLRQLGNPLFRTPGRKLTGSARICLACVWVSNLRGEEFKDALGRLFIRRKERRQRPIILLSQEDQIVRQNPSPSSLLLCIITSFIINNNGLKNKQLWKFYWRTYHLFTYGEWL
jgi:hypothetical protein